MMVRMLPLKAKSLDIETGELVEQDIIDGAQIEFIEHGFENPETQYMVIKNNGTYRNNDDVCRFVYDESDAW